MQHAYLCTAGTDSQPYGVALRVFKTCDPEVNANGYHAPAADHWKSKGAWLQGAEGDYGLTSDDLIDEDIQLHDSEEQARDAFLAE